MALMFRSVLQSGGGAELIVTCDSEFAGATISCSDGTTTLNKTCPVSSPYEVTFKIPNSGDWTISATVSGTTYTSDPISVDLDYETDLEFGFNWRRWVDTAQYLDSTDYSTLSDLLADEEALRELCLEHACVDYLCDSADVNPDLETIIGTDLFAKWVNNSDYALDNMYANEAIADEMDTADKYGYGEWVITDDTTTPKTWGAKGNVPVMTSNSAPYGEAFARDVLESGYAAYRAFDGNEASDDYHSSGTAPHYLGYHFTKPTLVKKVRYVDDGRAIGATLNYIIQGSNTGNANDYTDLKSGTITCGSAGTEHIIDVSNTTSYLYYRLYTANGYVGTSAGYLTCKALQFYGREISVSVPKMDTNTTPYGEADASSVFSSMYTAWKAFDGANSDNTDCWHSAQEATSWIQYEFITPMVIKGLYLRDRYAGVVPSISAVLQGSDDGVSFSNPLLSISYTPSDNAQHYFDVDNETPYKIYKLTFTNPSSNQYASMGQIQFYGVDYSEKEFEAGTTKKWLYDHGVELEEMEVYAIGSGSSATKGVQTLDLRAGGQGVSYYGQAITKNAIDLTPYNLLRAVVKDNIVIAALYLLVSSVKPYPNTNPTAYASITGNTLPNNNSLSISSVNQTAYPAIGVCGEAGKMSVDELWLE